MRLFLLALLPCLFCTCDRAPDTTVADDGLPDLPWKAATFLDPVATTLTFVNSSDTTASLSSDLRNSVTDFSVILPDSLSPGDSALITVPLSKPNWLFVRLGNKILNRIVLPGYARRLTYDGVADLETGPERDLYGYFDTLLDPINPVPMYPPEITNVTDYRDELTRQFAEHLDSVQVQARVPDWASDLLHEEIKMLNLYRPLMVKSYRQFFFKDTLPITVTHTDSVRRALNEPLAYHTPGYLDLHRMLVQHTNDRDPQLNISTRNNWAYADALLTDYPAPRYRDDAIVNYLMNEIADRRMYGGKAQIIDTLTASLPPAYQEKIAEFTEQVALRNASDEGMQAFLSTLFEDATGEMTTPLAIRRQTKTLYKFWFAGCYPCIVQQPYEVELLAENPDLEIVYVAFSTAKENWLPYLEEHDAPATANLYVPENQTELIQGALGRLGAPTYLLLDGDGEVVCSSCPKPSDPSFKTML